MNLLKRNIGAIGGAAPDPHGGGLSVPRLAGLLLLLLTEIAGGATGGETPSPEAIEFFERSIRPILTERCQTCHGPKQQWAGLRLDSREGMLRGGDSGPAVVPHKPDQSELLRRVAEEDDSLRMPPADKAPRLTPEQIALLRRWVEWGAPWPEPTESMAKRDAAWRSHWAFQPVRRPVPPAVADERWIRTPVDRFILQRLEERGFAPSPEADRRTLIRRATYDLTGQPPTPHEVDAFLQDDRPDAFDRLIERLLASPHYGEQWGRHWLDVARYSDTKGYVYAREERFFVHAPVYRDWVVRAFNTDLPYDRFLVLQIAADQAAVDDPAALAAMGFLTLGRRFLGVTPDIIDDRIDVVTRGTMGLTVACARCHDHKYDPIPTADYYSLYGVFQSCVERLVPIPPHTTTTEFEAELQKRRQRLAEATAAKSQEASERARQRVVDYLLAQRELDKYPVQGFDQILAKDDLIPAIVRRWETYLRAAADRQDPIFVPWLAFVDLPEEEFATKASEITQQLQTADDVHPRIAAAFVDPPSSARDVAERYGRIFAEVDRQWQELCESAMREGRSPPEALPDPNDEVLRLVLYGPGSPCVIPDEPIVNTESLFDSGTVDELWKLQNEVDRHLLQAPDAAPHAVILTDREYSTDPRIFHRGNPANQGEAVPRQFLQVVAGPNRQPFSQGSGRLELARAIASADNPLTARVWVNRVWMHHFGAGLVRTPSDFGLRADPPSHPELLDWLASELIANGWSTKALHRTILLSSTYRQASRVEIADSARRSAVSQTDAQSASSQQDSGFRIQDSAGHSGEQRTESEPDSASDSPLSALRSPPDSQLSTLDSQLSFDPENRLLGRMTARRLGYEEFRDTLLAVSGEMDWQMGGKAVESLPTGPAPLRRSLYGLVDRQFLPSVLRIFDFANPDLHSPQRSETTVPQQALFALNHPFVADRARAFAKRSNVGSGSAVERVARLYRLAFQREPSTAEAAAALSFLETAQAEAHDRQIPAAVAAWSYGYGELDESSGRLKSFQPLPYFSGSAWQGGPKWPDATLGWVQLTAQGGHAGNDLQHAAVRRWTAPDDGIVSISSLAIHEAAPGDGIRCWIVSSRTGVLKSVTLHNTREPLDLDALSVKTGDTLDFVVDYNANLNSDQFLWAPVIRRTDSAAAGDDTTHWSAEEHFAGPQPEWLDPWEQLAQVLLVSNELMFVD